MSGSNSANFTTGQTRRDTNTRRLCVPVIALTIIAAFGPALRAEDAKGRWIGIFIGVNNYGLKYASGDAQRQAQIFETQFGYDTTVFATDSIDDSGKQTWKPTLSNLQKQVPQILAKANGEDTVIVSFSGHGLLDDSGAGYLLAQDADLKDVYETSLPLSWLREQLRACRAKTKFILLDCCHAGTDKGVAIEPADQFEDASGQELGNSLKDVPGLLTLASCRAHQKSYELEKKEQGLFTHYLIEGLMRGADDDDDRKITVTEIYRYVRREVMDHAEVHLNANQVPVLVIDKAGVLNEAPIAKWSDPKLREVAELRGHDPSGNNRGGGPLPCTVSVSRNGKIAAAVPCLSSGEGFHTPIVWDLATGNVIARMSGTSPGSAASIALDRNGISLAGAGAFERRAVVEHKLSIWNVQNTNSVQELIRVSGRGNIQAVKFSLSGDKLVSVHAGGEVIVWDLQTGKQLHKYQGGQTAPQFSSDDHLLAVGMPELEVNVWDLGRNGFPARYKFPASVPRTVKPQYTTFRASIRALQFSSDDKQIVAIGGVLGQPFNTAVWDRVTGNLVSSKLIGTRPTAAAFVPDKQLAILGELDGTLGVWNLKTGTKVTDVPAHKSHVAGIAVSATGETIVTGGADGRVLVFKLTQ